MSAALLIGRVQAAGGTIRAEGGRLKLAAPAPLPSDLVESLRQHKAEVLAALTGEDVQAEDLREGFEERAGILEHDGGLPRNQAEAEAARMVATLARNRGYSWAALREALRTYPELLAQIPDRSGTVDNLPLGLARFAVLPSRRVIRQGIAHARNHQAACKGAGRQKINQPKSNDGLSPDDGEPPR